MGLLRGRGREVTSVTYCSLPPPTPVPQYTSSLDATPSSATQSVAVTQDSGTSEIQQESVPCKTIPDIEAKDGLLWRPTTAPDEAAQIIQSPAPSPPSYDQPSYDHLQLTPFLNDGSRANANVSFHSTEPGDSSAPISKSLVRLEREKSEPGHRHRHRQWYSHSQVTHLEEGRGRVGVIPSGNYPRPEALHRGRSLLAREEDVHESGLALAVFESSVLDLELLAWLDPTQVTFPTLFTETVSTTSTNPWALMSEGHYLQDLITVLYLSLIFPIGVVLIRFVMAVLFAWSFSWKIGTFPKDSYAQRMQRAEAVEAPTSCTPSAASAVPTAPPLARPPLPSPPRSRRPHFAYLQVRRPGGSVVGFGVRMGTGSVQTQTQRGGTGWEMEEDVEVDVVGNGVDDVIFIGTDGHLQQDIYWHLPERQCFDAFASSARRNARDSASRCACAARDGGTGRGMVSRSGWAEDGRARNTTTEQGMGSGQAVDNPQMDGGQSADGQRIVRGSSADEISVGSKFLVSVYTSAWAETHA
ncbi:hypothetical protein DFH07DRAFT_990494 [Mycena maculata]|uniref:Chitin synthase 4-like domain-containing protein n=1 Tax=Mycena maculata TaxID=230809 RepID=A0AAD7I2W5_9AGAR|nr:hypothetical protein DFH07DRAFT_990494 [Mycena maculata]